MTKSILMHLAPLQFHVQIKVLADINSCTVSVLFQMRGAQRPEDQSSSGERKGWDAPLAVLWLLPAKQWYQQDFLKIKSLGAAPCLCRWQQLLGQKGNCFLALLAGQQDLQSTCGSVWAGQVRNLQGRHRGELCSPSSLQVSWIFLPFILLDKQE